MKIKLKNYKLAKGIRASIWTFFKNIYLGFNSENVFRINLNFIKCDVKEIKKELVQFQLLPGIDEANKLIENILQQYNYKKLEELKQDKKALQECIIKLYNLNTFTQAEIATIVGISASKVSKLIQTI